MDEAHPVRCLKCGKDIPLEGVKFCPWCGKNPYAPHRAQNKKNRGNGQGSVYKEGDTWTASVVKYYITGEDGKRRPKRARKKGFKLKKDAVAYLSVLVGQKARKIPTLEDYWRVWESADLPKLSASKQTAYKIARGKLEDIFHTPVNQLTIEDLQNTVTEKAPTYYPAKDIKTVLSHLFTRAAAQGDVPTNLAEYIVLPTLIEKEQQPFSKDEQNALWKLFGEGDQFAPYILLMIYTGMMPGELLIARKDNIDWEKQKITGCGKKTKKRKETPIVLPDLILPVLARICESPGDKLIHINRDNFYSEYHACLARAGCRDLPPYSCRHTTGTALGTADIPIAIVKELMRHTKITTTQRYMHVDTETMLEAANKAQHRSDEDTQKQ